MFEYLGIALAVVLIGFLVYNLFIKRDKGSTGTGTSKPIQWPWGKRDTDDRDV